jgi:hypothetical membrane protein
MRRAGATWLIAGLLWFGLEAIAARAFPGYDYAHNYISDLGIPSPQTLQGRDVGSPLALVMNVNFIAHGALFLIGAVFAFRATEGGIARFAFLAFAAINAFGNVLYGAEIAIVIAGLSAGRLGATASYRAASVALGALGIACISILVAAPGTGFPKGVWERLGVYPIMTWEIMTGLSILVSSRPGTALRKESTA